MTITFTVPGVPKTKGRPRAFFNKHTGRVATHTPKETQAAEADFVLLASQARPPAPLEGALELTVRFVMPVPGSGPKAFRARALAELEAHPKRPDADNLLKLVMDAMNGVFWKDDSQVAGIHVLKVYGEVPRTEVRLTSISVG